MYAFLDTYKTFPYVIEDKLTYRMVLNPPFVGDIPDALKITEEYKAFLRYSNGAVLYFDSKYGQWGLVLHGVTPFELVYDFGKTANVRRCSW